MKTAQIYPSKWLAAADLQDQHQTFTITGGDIELVGEDSKLVLYFRGIDKGLVVNRTNCKSMEIAFGSDETDDWIGRRVVLFPTQVDFQGKTCDAIRVHVKKTQQLMKQEAARAAMAPTPAVATAAAPAGRSSGRPRDPDPEPDDGEAFDPNDIPF